MRRIREEKALSIPALAATVGASEGALRQVESGQTKVPSLVLGVRIANALGIDPTHLALGEHSSLNERFDDLDRRFRAMEKRLAVLESRRR